MKYIVQAVEDNELPEGITLVIVEREGGPNLLLVAGEHARGWHFLRAWEDSREPCEVPTLLYAV